MSTGISKKYIGIWIDRRKAVLVVIEHAARRSEEDGSPSITRIDSDIERRVRLSGGSRTGNAPWGPQNVAVDSKIEAHQKQQLDDFFKRIVASIKNADRVLIMGPGETKHGLKRHLEKSKAFAGKIAGLETCDKMTDKQVAAHVRSFFQDH